MRGKRLIKANAIAHSRANRIDSQTGFPWAQVIWRKFRKTTKPCSCWMCRNLRANEGKTLQEIKQELKLQDWLEEG